MALIDDRDGTLTDTESRLMWQKEDDGIQRSQQKAFDYCASLSLACFADWRLPTLSEFNGLRVAGGNIHSPRGGSNSEYWTATAASHPSIPKDIVGTIAHTSEGLTFSKDEEFYVLAVRQITDSAVGERGQAPRYAKRETKKWWQFWK